MGARIRCAQCYKNVIVLTITLINHLEQNLDVMSTVQWQGQYLQPFRIKMQCFIFSILAYCRFCSVQRKGLFCHLRKLRLFHIQRKMPALDKSFIYKMIFTDHFITNTYTKESCITALYSLCVKNIFMFLKKESGSLEHK